MKFLPKLYQRNIYTFISLILLGVIFRIMIPFYREYIYPDSVLWIKYSLQIAAWDFRPVLGGEMRPLESMFKYTPGYSFFIALCNLLVKDPIRASLIVSFIFGVINPILTFLIARKVADKLTAYIAGIIACVHPVAVKMSCNSLINTTVSFFFLLVIYVLLKYMDTGKKKYSVLLGLILFAVYLCRFELGLLYFLIVPVWCLVFFHRKALLQKTREVFYPVSIFMTLFLVHSLYMLKFTGMPFSEYLCVHVKPAMQVNQWISMKIDVAPPKSPFPELEKDTSLIESLKKERDEMPILKRALKLFESLFDSYEHLLIFLYIVLFLKIKSFRLKLKYEEILLVFFALSFLFIATLALRSGRNARYLYHLIYLFCPLYASLVIFLAKKAELWKPGLFTPVIIILLCPLFYKGISYNIKSAKENTLSRSYHRVVGDWIKSNYRTGKILVTGDNRYALFSSNYSYLVLVNSREELLKRARIVGASILVMDAHDMENFPALKPVFMGEDRQFISIHDSIFGDKGLVKIFRINTDTNQKSKDMKGQSTI